MSNLEFLLWTALAVAGLIGSAWCSGMEIGFYSVNRVRLDVRAARGVSSARVLKNEVDRPDRVISTLLLSNNVFNYLAALGITGIVTGAGLTGVGLILVNVLVLTPILLIFGESLPKELFRIDADRLTYRFARVLRTLRVLATASGALPLILSVARAAGRLVGGVDGDVLPQQPRRRIEMLLKEGAAQGTLSASQATLVERALAMRGATVGDEMVPWARVHTIGLDWPHRRILDAMHRHSHAYYPIVDSSGRVVGVIRQAMVYASPDRSIADLILQPARLHPDLPVLEAIGELRGSPAGVGIVLRGGRPIGLARERDLIEPLTGELGDWT